MSYGDSELVCAMQSKAVLLGNSGVGKTAFMEAVFDDADRQLARMPRNTNATIGVDFRRITRRVDNGERFRILLWDTAGQERFASLAPHYTRESEAIIVLFDLTDSESFADLGRRWLPIIDAHRDAVGSDNVLVYLVGSKRDKHEDRVVDPIASTEFARAHGMTYVETTSLVRAEPHGVLNEIIQRLYDMRSKPNAQPLAAHSTVGIRTRKLYALQPPKNKRNCCS
jgi:small GTP-binding protein